MLTDHAILLKKSNFDQILQETPAQVEALDELVMEMLEAGEGPLYLVFYRLENGLPTWIVLNEEELMERYDLETIGDRFTNRFEKIVA